MRYEVPQFIEIEDKIFGDLSLKQFIYVAGGLGALVVLYFWLPSFLLFLLAAPFVIALSFGLAFVPVNKRPLSVLLESVFIYFSRARLYLWKKEARTPVATNDSRTTTVVKSYQPPSSRDTIASLSRDLEIKALSEEVRPTEKDEK